jgi:hypothetical protein
MTLSKDTAVPRVPLQHPWSAKLGATGKKLRAATQNIAKQYKTSSLTTKQRLTEELTKAKKAHANSINNAPSLRRQMLLDMADNVALNRKCSISSAIRQIQNAEESRQTHRKHKFIMKGPHPGRIQHVVVPTPSLSQTTIWTKLEGPEMETALNSHIESHLTASRISPFAHGPLTQLLPPKDRNMRTLLTPLISKADLSFSYGHLGQSISSILNELDPKCDKAGNILKFQWTFDSSDFKAAFGKARTKTAPGFSGMSMSLWKAIADEDDLSGIYAKLIELPFRYGFTYPRWEHSILAMLQKKDLPYLNKLRIIELFELDLNAFLKLVMGRVYPKFEKANDLQHPES